MDLNYLCKAAVYSEIILKYPFNCWYQFPVVHQGRFSSRLYQCNALFYPWC